ncbi:lysozyme inhibitor LprI family protein [Dyella flagellata]|uniref:Lysozyme inhibitor LprI-like N-terminal domain-containing protein n=1 Tax=Dyella flagellata TaxID=1867833 RepID=A0ABQ5XFB1_9GAMM|nr:lysozyme inhibitor LprI family protein [Dyella flagellata]GLQ89657.1 hypothetical protein GCM10007898_32320 [Dyella flagellata]
MKKALLALLMLGAAFAVHADQPMSDHGIVDHYCAKANTQRDMDECAAAALKDADRQLNATYQAALKKWAAFPDTTAKLRQAQRSWLAYRDADVAARFALADKERAQGTAGTAYPMAHSLYQAGLEFERVARLCEFLRGDAYGERDTASCADLAAHPAVVPHQP